MRLAWVKYRYDAADNFARGYGASAIALRQALVDHGVEVVDVEPGEAAHPRLHLHYAPLHRFEPLPGKHNALFSMWEVDLLPANVLPRMAAADTLIVPSRYCEAVWNLHGFKAHVVPLGVNAAWATCDPSRSVLVSPGKRRRFLYVGSKSTRKGWQLLGPAWKLAMGARFDAQLYLKVLGDGSMTEHYGGSVVLDQRDLPADELLELYRSAEVFVFPTYAEGFGLPALEAMASGCLVVAPLVGGLTEFVSPATAIPVERPLSATIQYGVEINANVASTQSLAAALRFAHEDWGTPVMESLRAYGTRVAREFTWQATAAKLVAALSQEPAGVDVQTELVVPPSNAAPARQRGLRLVAAGRES